MEFDCKMKKEFGFIDKMNFDNDITENELDHVFTGRFIEK
jgi:hypothetical protein